jgi:hypothetical protein
MNPNKCAFGVSARELLGFLVHEGGIEVGKKSMKAIDEVVPPTNLKELQSLLGKNNFLRRFILNLPQKVLPFSPLLRIKKDQKFVWGGEQQKAFDEIKWYVKEPPVLVPPQLNKSFKLYVVADAQTIGSALRPSTLVVLQNLLQNRIFHPCHRNSLLHIHYYRIHAPPYFSFIPTTKLWGPPFSHMPSFLLRNAGSSASLSLPGPTTPSVFTGAALPPNPKPRRQRAPPCARRLRVLQEEAERTR